jgi:hypothetical protein
VAKNPAPILDAVEARRSQDVSSALTRTAWVPRGDLRLMEWVEHGRRLGVIGRGVGWWIGDWLRYGNLKFGERYVRASRITGYDVQTLMNMVYVASAYDVTERRDELSFSHHAELAALAPEDRGRLLDLAVSKRLSVRCLREELRRERRLRKGEAAEAPGDVALTDAAHADAMTAHELRCPQCGCRMDAPR